MEIKYTSDSRNEYNSAVNEYLSMLLLAIDKNY